MRPQYCVFRNRFIALSICLCALLVFGTTLSADTYQFSPGKAISGLTAFEGVSGSSIGPYGGTLAQVDSHGNTTYTSPNSIFFCLTGNASYITPYETGTWSAPSTPAQEESAYLVSLMLGNEVTDHVILGTTGTGNSKTVTVSGNASDISKFENGTAGPPVQPGLAQIQLAIWDVNNTLPSGITYSGLDTETKYIIGLAMTVANYSIFAGNSNYMVFTTTSGGQNFMEVPSVPEPGTMVLFGTGALLMALGCARRRLARRPR
jgi:hypothetical protein